MSILYIVFLFYQLTMYAVEYFTFENLRYNIASTLRKEKMKIELKTFLEDDTVDEDAFYHEFTSRY